MAPHDGPVGPYPEGVDHEEYDRKRRRVMWKMSSGLYLLGSGHGNEINLMTCNLVSQLSFDPKLVGVSVEKHARTHELIEASRSFALSILRRSDRAVVRKFVKPAVHDVDAHTLNGLSFRIGVVSGSPIYEGALAFMDFRLHDSLDLSTHTLFIGEVGDAGFLGDEDEDVLRMEDTRMSYGG